MCRASQILRKPVIVGPSGEQVGRVTNLIFDDRNNRVLGVLVNRMGIFGRVRVLPFRDIYKIGRDAIIATTRDALVRPQQVPEIGRIDRRSAVKGKPLITADGRILGRVVDLRIDESTGTIEAYELSPGGLSGLLANRKVLPARGGFTAGDDVVLAPTGVCDSVEPADGPSEATPSSAPTHS